MCLWYAVSSGLPGRVAHLCATNPQPKKLGMPLCWMLCLDLRGVPICKALHLVEGLDWSRLKGVVARQSRQQATPLHVSSSHLRVRESSDCVWLGSCVHRFSTHSFSCRGCVACMNLQLTCTNVPGLMHASRLAAATHRWLGLIQTCEDATKGRSCLNVAEPFLLHCPLDESRSFNDTSSAIPKTMLFPRRSFLNVCHPIARILVPRAPAIPQNPCNAMTIDDADELCQAS